MASPLIIEEQGSFAAGGKVVTSPGTYTGTPDIVKGKSGNDFMDVFRASIEAGGQTLHGDHATVFYQIPAEPRKLPLVFLHGAGQSMRTWQTTPDGREGFQNIFLRKRYPVYLVDQPRRGWSGRSTVDGTIPATPDDQFWFDPMTSSGLRSSASASGPTSSRGWPSRRTAHRWTSSSGR